MRRLSRGWTIVELLIAIIFAIIVLIGVLWGLVYLFGEVRKSRGRTELERDADVAAYWVELVVREGSWAYLDGGQDSLAVQNFLQGWTKRIYADGSSLMADVEGQLTEVLTSLAGITFRPSLSQVEYEVQVQAGGRTFRFNSSKSMRNVHLRGLWHFSEGAGTAAYDDSPYNNNAAVFGAAWGTGAEGGGLYFDGEDDYLMVPDNDALDSGRRLAFEAFVSPQHLGPRHTIIQRGEAGSNEGLFWVYLQGHKIYYAFRKGSIRRVSSASLGWEPGRWYRITVQHDGLSGRVHIYRDGVLVGSSQGADDPIPVTSGNLYIGAYQGDEDFWEGGLDEVRFADFGG